MTQKAIEPGKISTLRPFFHHHRPMFFHDARIESKIRRERSAGVAGHRQIHELPLSLRQIGHSGGGSVTRSAGKPFNER
jgi:hypothetical protein